MSESTYESYLKKGLRALGAHVVKHNDAATGIPDLSACLLHNTQWIEVKASDAWPVRPLTPVRWPHYTEEQALFLRMRGGWLTARIDRHYMLWDARAAWEIWEDKGWCKEALLRRAVYKATGRIDFNHFRSIIWGSRKESVAMTVSKAPAAQSESD